jgi:hypothetical protein
MVRRQATDAFRETLDSFGAASFSTKHFVEKYRGQYPLEWQEIEDAYGVGGKGAGRHYSSFSHVAHVLNALFKAGALYKLHYERAPAGWGSRVIRFWTLSREASGGVLYPDEACDPDEIFEEGAKSRVVVNRYERDKKARLKCIEYYGLACQCCGIDFEKRYGKHGAGFIHVHHRALISKAGGPYHLDPIKDLIPLCPNCHAMVHYCNPMLSIEDLRRNMVHEL